MKADRFYSVPYDARNNTKVLMLRNIQGGIVAFGRWQALLGMLYDQDGRIDTKNAGARLMLQHELELTAEELDTFIADCIDCQLLSAEAWEQWQVVMSPKVLDQIEYHKTRSEAGKMGGRPKKPDAGETPKRSAKR